MIGEKELEIIICVLLQRPDLEVIFQCFVKIGAMIIGVEKEVSLMTM